MGFQQSFKALSDPTRRGILRLLREGPLPAGEIVERFPMTGATISHHLSILRDAGLVLDEKKGKYIYYELNTSVVDELLGWLTSLKGDAKDERTERSGTGSPGVDCGIAAAGDGGGSLGEAAGADPLSLGV